VHTPINVLNGPCHWLWKKVVSDLRSVLQTFSISYHFNHRNLASRQLFNCWSLFVMRVFSAAFSLSSADVLIMKFILIKLPKGRVGNRTETKSVMQATWTKTTQRAWLYCCKTFCLQSGYLSRSNNSAMLGSLFHAQAFKEFCEFSLSLISSVAEIKQDWLTVYM